MDKVILLSKYVCVCIYVYILYIHIFVVLCMARIWGAYELTIGRNWGLHFLNVRAAVSFVWGGGVSKRAFLKTAPHLFLEAVIWSVFPIFGFLLNGRPSAEVRV